MVISVNDHRCERVFHTFKPIVMALMMAPINKMYDVMPVSSYGAAGGGGGGTAVGGNEGTPGIAGAR